VNDPGMTDTTEVKASIKLRFNNSGGETNVINRSLQLTKKKVKLEFKALDGMLKMKDAEGKQTSLSMKCADLDKHIPLLLGVQSSILENVIFCHQEESSWPMLEGAVLKKKFDDIFESTRYTKALETFAKTKKEYQLIAKDHKAEMMEFGAHLQAVNQYKQELNNCDENQRKYNEDLAELNSKLENNRAKSDSINEELHRCQEKMNQLNDMQQKSLELDTRIAERKSNIQQERTESDKDLLDLMENFGSAMQQKSGKYSLYYIIYYPFIFLL